MTPVRRLTVLGVLAATAAVLAATTSAATASHRVFYLAMRAGDCTTKVASKWYLVMPCANARHRFEVYAVGHGGWGTAPPSHSAAFARVEQLCTSTFQRRYGGPIGTGYGWWAIWADAGAEAEKYGDRVVCALVRWPEHPPMGPGTHFRQAARR
jgi:hypothetical protein